MRPALSSEMRDLAAELGDIVSRGDLQGFERIRDRLTVRPLTDRVEVHLRDAIGSLIGAGLKQRIEREAALLRVPAIAFSQQSARGERTNWKTAERFGAEIVRALMAEPWPDGVLFNVNFPPRPPEAVKGVRITQQGRRASQTVVKDVVGPYGRRFVWVGDYTDDLSPTRASDLAAVAAGFISVTPLPIDNTHRGSLKRLKELFP